MIFRRAPRVSWLSMARVIRSNNPRAMPMSRPGTAPPRSIVPQGVDEAEAEGEEHAQAHALHAGLDDTVLLDVGEPAEGPAEVGRTAAAQGTVIDEPAERHRRAALARWGSVVAENAL